jgi:hypothetical protein
VYYNESSVRLTSCTISGSVWGENCHSEVGLTAALINCIIPAEFSACGNLDHCFTGADPLFVNSGVFDFTRYTAVIIGEEEVELPDFIVEAPDYHLQPGSPAIDAGTSEGAPDTDCEGTARPQGLTYDIGAYEFPGPFGPDFLRGDTNDDGAVDLSDAVYTLDWLFLGEPAPGCVAAANVNGDESIDISDPVSLLGFLFLGGTAPATPFPECGPPSLPPDFALGCETPPESCD